MINELQRLIVEKKYKEIIAKPFNYWFRQQVIDAPDRVAVSFNNNHLSYSELSSRSENFSSYLQTNCKQGSLIGVFMERSDNLLVSLLGILLSGNSYLPIDP